MRMERDWYAVKEVEKELNVSRPTLYRYIENHGHYLKTNKVDNAILIHHQSLDTLREIREQYENGKRKKQIEEYLKNKAVPLHITVRDNDVRTQESQGISEINEIKRLLETSTKLIVHAMNENLEKQGKEHHDNIIKLQETHEKTVRELVKEVHDSREEIQLLKDELVSRENNRDQQLMSLIRDMQETKKIMAATQGKTWWQFWK
jgi:Protein of unknown function (DUF3967)